MVLATLPCAQKGPKSYTTEKKKKKKKKDCIGKLCNLGDSFSEYVNAHL